jgi:flagellar basal-body rod protein FlgB
VIDETTNVIAAALNGLSARQRVIADNLANLETPGYLAGQVSFEDELRAAVSRGTGVGDVTPRRSESSAATNTNGNNVRVDDEVVALTETGLRYQLMVEAMNSKLRILRTAIGGR